MLTITPTMPYTNQERDRVRARFNGDLAEQAKANGELLFGQLTEEKVKKFAEAVASSEMTLEQRKKVRALAILQLIRAEKLGAYLYSIETMRELIGLRVASEVPEFILTELLEQAFLVSIVYLSPEVADANTVELRETFGLKATGVDDPLDTLEIEVDGYVATLGQNSAVLFFDLLSEIDGEGVGGELSSEQVRSALKEAVTGAA